MPDTRAIVLPQINTDRQQRLRYVASLALVIAAFLLREVLSIYLTNTQPYITLFWAVFASAFIGGLGPAVLATTLCTFGAYVALLPADMPPSARLLGLVIFASTGVGAGLLGALRLRAEQLARNEAARADYEALHAVALRGEAERTAELAEEQAALAEENADLAAARLEETGDARVEMDDFFENATIPCHWFDEDGIVIRANRAAAELLCYDRDEYIGRSIVELHADPEAARRFLEQLQSDDKIAEFASTLVAKDRTVREVMVSSSVYRKNGVFGHTRSFLRDVTEQRHAEDALRALQRLESVGRLAGGVAHEVNNQMSIVLGAAGFVLRNSEIPEPVREDANLIQAAAQRTAALTSQLLAFSRRQVLKLQVQNGDVLIAEFATVLRRALGEKSELLLRLRASDAHVNVDRSQFEQVLLNLALNAADAMEGGGALTITTENVELRTNDSRILSDIGVTQGHYVVLTVTDTGSGMPPETVHRAFEPFFTTKGPGKGTGLGLSTVYGIIRQSGGHITVSSSPSEGTTFVIYLPVAEAPSDAATTARVESARRPGRRATVLVVEDEHAVRRITARTLQEAGFEVIEAENASAALARLARAGEQVDLVLSDMMMPLMRGDELALRIRQDRPQLPVLLMTGYTATSLDDTAGFSSLFPIIQKPFGPELLMDRVRHALLEAASPPAALEPDD